MSDGTGRAEADRFAATGPSWPDAFGEAGREAFRRACMARLEKASPQRIDGRVLLGVPCLFIIAIRF